MSRPRYAFHDEVPENTLNKLRLNNCRTYLDQRGISAFKPAEPSQKGLKSELWQQNEYLLSSGEYSDCTFVVGTKPHTMTFHCHKLMLAKCSAVFGAMLFGPLAEEKEIKVTDVKPEVFKAMLQYIYTCRVEMKDYRMALDLCMAADKYLIAALKEFCIKKLTDDLTPQNACQVHEVAKGLNLTNLEELAFKMIIERTDEVLASAEFLNVSSHGEILLLVQQESLNINSEAQLIQVCLQWAEHEAKQKGLNEKDTEDLRKVLGSILKHLRFLVLDHKEFADVTENSNVLTDSEKYKLLFSIIKKDITQIPDGFSKSNTARIKSSVSLPIFTFSKCGIASYPVVRSYRGHNYPYLSTTNPITSILIMNFTVDTDVSMTGFMAGYVQNRTHDDYERPAHENLKLNPFQSVFLQGLGISENVKICASLLVSENCYKYRFEKCVVLTKNELYSLTLISQNLQHDCIAMPQAVLGKNIYTDESLVICTAAKKQFVGGIVYKKV